MNADVSLMVLPTGAQDFLPQILMQRGGVWRDMSPPLAVRAAESTMAMRTSIDRLLDQLMAQLRNRAPFSWRALRAEFRGHYGIVVPLEVHTVLQTAAQSASPGEVPVLRIHMHTSTEWIPWEMLHDGTDFLGLRFRIARLPIMSKGPELGETGPHPLRCIYSLLAENVFDPQDRGDLRAKWKDTFAGLIPATVDESRFPELNGAPDVFPTVDQLMESAAGDIVHVTCHGGYRDERGHYWTLNHESPATSTYHITSTILNDLNLTARPLVFGNACASTAAAAGQGGLTPGFGATFFAQGALAFIGTFAPITQQMAVGFAREFYARLLRIDGEPGLPVGTALWETKHHFKGLADSDPSYLYYCLYGPPETSFRTV